MRTLAMLLMFSLTVGLSLPTSSLSSSGMDIGDVVFADGTVIKTSDLTELKGDNLPVAIIAGFRDDGTALGVGVHRSGTPLPWAIEDATGYTTQFDGIISTLGTADGNAANLHFAGDRDGSDNWTVIRSIDKGGAVNAEKNYPAYNFVNTYAAKHGLTGPYAFGWYMPSIEELCVVYRNRAAVNASLEKIHSLNRYAAMEGLGTNWYWSSSQSGLRDEYVWFIHYFNGYTCDCPKNFTNLHVLAVRAF